MIDNAIEYHHNVGGNLHEIVTAYLSISFAACYVCEQSGFPLSG